jgi:hypothetical protein
MRKSDWPFSYQGRPISCFTERCAHLADEFVSSLILTCLLAGITVTYCGFTSCTSTEIAVTRSCVRNHFGDVKTEASRKPVPIHPPVRDALLMWWGQTLYSGDGDFLFPSMRLQRKQPVSPDTVLMKIIRPALQQAGGCRQGDRLAFIPAQLGDQSAELGR